MARTISLTQTGRQTDKHKRNAHKLTSEIYYFRCSMLAMLLRLFYFVFLFFADSVIRVVSVIFISPSTLICVATAEARIIFRFVLLHYTHAYSIYSCTTPTHAHTEHIFAPKQNHLTLYTHTAYSNSELSLSLCDDVRTRHNDAAAPADAVYSRFSTSLILPTLDCHARVTSCRATIFFCSSSSSSSHFIFVIVVVFYVRVETIKLLIRSIRIQYMCVWVWMAYMNRMVAECAPMLSDRSSSLLSALSFYRFSLARWLSFTVSFHRMAVVNFGKLLRHCRSARKYSQIKAHKNEKHCDGDGKGTMCTPKRQASEEKNIFPILSLLFSFRCCPRDGIIFS